MNDLCFNLVYNINRFIFAVKYNQLYSSTQFNLMEDKILNEKESLELISQMIRNTQQKLESGHGKPFLIFGYISIVISLAVYGLLVMTNSYYSNLLWYAIPVLGAAFMFMFGRKKEKYVKTYIDRIINNTWGVIGAAMILIAICAFFFRLPVISVILLLSGIAITLTGLTIKFKPIIVCGIIGMATCILPFIFKGDEQVLIFAAAIFIMMVIPGHILHLKSRN
jgi:hypothetical protein